MLTFAAPLPTSSEDLVLWSPNGKVIKIHWVPLTLIMVYKSHLIRATSDALDFLDIFQEP